MNGLRQSWSNRKQDILWLSLLQVHIWFLGNIAVDSDVVIKLDLCLRCHTNGRLPVLRETGLWFLLTTQGTSCFFVRTPSFDVYACQSPWKTDIGAATAYHTAASHESGWWDCWSQRSTPLKFKTCNEKNNNLAGQSIIIGWLYWEQEQLIAQLLQWALTWSP